MDVIDVDGDDRDRLLSRRPGIEADGVVRPDG
jgi:hypothetical protein